MSVVLIVEDEEIIRKGIRYSVPLEECGCSVVGEAENGAAGEEKIAELQPDIVITDITMPVKNGLEMIADTREEAHAGINAYISQYYPELSKAMDLLEWGPIGTPDDIVEWIETFAAAGVDYFICRFGSLDQFGQVERFAKDVLPRVMGDR